MSELSCMETIPCVKQGDAYDLRIALDFNGETLTAEHLPLLEPVEDEFYVTLDHPMSKEHYISFLAAVGDNGTQLVKLYPEGEAEARFKLSRVRWLYVCCNRHGLFRLAVKRKK